MPRLLAILAAFYIVLSLAAPALGKLRNYSVTALSIQSNHRSLDSKSARILLAGLIAIELSIAVTLCFPVTNLLGGKVAFATFTAFGLYRSWLILSKGVECGCTGEITETIAAGRRWLALVGVAIAMITWLTASVLIIEYQFRRENLAYASSVGLILTLAATVAGSIRSNRQRFLDAHQKRA